MSHAEDPSGTRRDFLYYATAGTGVVVTGAAVWPLVNQMNPSADVQAASQMRVDVSGVAVGTQLTVLFLGKPVFIRHRSEEEIAEARAVELSDLPDRMSRNPNIDESADASDENRSMADFSGENTGEWLVQIGVCTHLGCVPIGDGAGDFNGWFCPCHGSHYDNAGRIRRGPAPENLHIPVAEFVDETTILLG
ncbi:MAG: ubiquinol-cytochrome c reductase iron-sulfur subunit PetA [Rhodobacteraceae bacterium HLUCCO18]|nr:MAG: ubiquinol-cytochrome c reductase iron-sulfur subunit PetA [Rhodobacteraceae bacterium HLUCCO18]